ELKRPAILKPVRGSASCSVIKIDGPAAIEAAWNAFPETERNRFIVEEFLEGPEFSVESFSFNGFHSILAVTEKHCSESFVELGHVLPAALPKQTEDEIVACVRNFLDLVTLKDGPAHTEVKLTLAGPRIVEGHNRVGGDKINELVEL